MMAKAGVKNGKEQLEWLTALLDKLPSEFKAWAIISVLILGAIWFLRKGKEERLFP